jgi:acetyl esterase/lipase
MAQPRLSPLRRGGAVLGAAAMLSLWSPACAVPPASTVPAPVVEVTVSEYQYGASPIQHLTLYRPQPSQGETDDGRLPFVLWSHEGAWISGDNDQIPPVVAALPQVGIAVAAVSYRLADAGNPFPAQVIDLKSAATWLAAHADELGLDPGRAGLIGESSGAHVGALAAMSFGEEGLAPVGGPELRLRAVVALAGPARPELFLGTVFDHPVRRFLGCPIFGDCWYSAGVDTMTHFDGSDPPLLGLYGDADVVVPAWMGEDQQVSARAAGIDSTLVIVPGADHGTIGQVADFPQLVFWLRLRLASSPPPDGTTTVPTTESDPPAESPQGG